MATMDNYPTRTTDRADLVVEFHEKRIIHSVQGLGLDWKGAGR